MPFTISDPSANPNPLNLPGSSTISYQIDGTAGTNLSIGYILSDSNNIIFQAGPQKDFAGPPVTLTGDTTNIDQVLDFTSDGDNDMVAFFLTIKVVNTANNATKIEKCQIRLS